MPVTQSNLQYDYFLPIWQAVRDCVDGQKKIKARGAVYLPEFSIKDEPRYNAYKERAMFLGVTQRTLSSLVGAAIKKAPQVELPNDMEYLREDADNSGNSLNQLFRSSVFNVTAVGRHGLLTDYPSAEGELTIEDVNRMGLRPSIKEYKAENIINWRVDAGKLVLVVLREVTDADVDDFTVKAENRYRVLRIVDGVYVQEIYDEGGSVVSNGEPKKADGSRWDSIPFVFAGSMNNAPDIDSAPMYDLSVVNIAHYRNSADYEEGVFIHGQPMLHIDIGTMSADQWEKLNPNGIQVGARRGITTNGGGSANLMQAQANGAAKEAMDQKESQMLMIGARLVEEGGASKTATAVLSDSAAEHSVLSSSVANVGEAVEQCIKWACEFQGSNPDDVEVIMNLEFFDKMPDAQMMAAMMGLEDRGHMAQADIRGYLRKTGLIDQDRTDEEIDKETNEDGGTGTGDAE